MPDERTMRAAPSPKVLRAFAAGALAFGAGCQGLGKFRDNTYDTFRSLVTDSYHDADPDAKLAQAEAMMGAGDTKGARKLFGDIADNKYNPVLLAEKARFLEAECLRQEGKHFDAVAYYNRMINDHPTGAYRERGCAAMYEIAYGWLRESTLSKIEAELQGQAKPWYLDVPSSLPNFSDKSKPMMDQEGEALKYLEAVYTHDLTGPAADKALFWCGYVHFYRGRYEEADHFFSQIVELHKDSPLRKEALRLAVIAKNNSTGGAVYDSTKASQALQLVNAIEATEPEYRNDAENASWLLRQKVAVRLQLAEKDFRRGEYYERIGKPASAWFCYDLVVRRYPGTKLAEQAQERLTALQGVRAQMEADRAAGKPASTMEMLRAEWTKLTGLAPAEVGPRGLAPAMPQ